jgi:tetratricopeptide (TPR) repeat protein
LIERLAALRNEIAALEAEHRLRDIAAPLREVVDLTGAEAGAESREYVAALNELGSLLRTLRELDESEARFRQAADIELRVRGRSADYATCINNLAGTYRLKGDHEAAEALFEEALAIYETEVGTEHFVYLSALNNLGLVYQDLKRYDDAERLHQQALGALQRSGGQDTALATTLNNLASVAMATKRYGEAQGFLRRALEVYRETAGARSVLYLTGVNNLAAACFLAGDYTGAEAGYQEATTLMEQVLGPDHPDTLRARNGLARTRDNLAAGGDG